MPRKAHPPNAPPCTAKQAAKPDGPTDFEPLGTTPLPKKPFYVVIPTVESFAPDERAEYEAGRYSLRICEHIPEHRDFIDYLIDGSLSAWTRSPV